MMLYVSTYIDLAEQRRSRRRVAYLFLGALLFAGGTAALGWRVWDDDPAHLPAWIEAIATLFAFAAAGTAVFYAAGAFRLEHQREQRWLESKQSEQASTVAAWPGQRIVDVGPGGSLGSRMMTTFPNDGVYVRNASQVPVTVVRAVAVINDEVASVLTREAVPPDAEPQFWKWDYDFAHTIDHVRKDRGDDWHPHVDLYFTDSSGLRWYRSYRGSLTQLWHSEPLPKVGDYVGRTC